MRSRQINFLSLPAQEMVILALCLTAYYKMVADVVGYLHALFLFSPVSASSFPSFLLL